MISKNCPVSETNLPVTDEPIKVSEAEAASDNLSSPHAVSCEAFSPIDLDDFSDSKQQELLGLNHFREGLQRRELKCGGSLSDRALRLFSIKGLSQDEISPMLLVKPLKKK